MLRSRSLFFAFPLVSSALALLGCGGGGDTASTATSGGTSATSSSGSGGSGGGGGAGGSLPMYPPAFTIPAFDKGRITSDSNQPNFQQATVDVDWKDGPNEKVLLTVDLESTCYPFDNWKTDKPPAGQNWPADCDAFDRNFEFSIDDAVMPTDPPGIELVRAITPFGGPEHLEVDITDVANGLPGKHKLKVTIPTYSDGAGKVSGSNGGWNVTAKIDVTPGKAPHKVLAVIPLWDSSQTVPMSPDPIPFMVPAGTTGSRVEYRVTGHGGGAAGPGCIGPAEEFCHRSHSILVDGMMTQKVDPWRKDCAKNCTVTHYAPFNLDYCLENPCGDMNSVKASRANWCPGTMTPPFNLDLAPLKTPGMHTFSWTISQVLPGGSWRLSAVYLAFGD